MGSIASKQRLWRVGRRRFLKGAATLAGAAAVGGFPRNVRAAQGAREIRVAYMPHPIHQESIKWMKVWAAKNNVTIAESPISYEVYVEKMTANLTSGGDQYDVIWHNDDWGQLWGRYLAPVDDVPAVKVITPFIFRPFFVWEGHYTGLPFVETVGTFFYRPDVLGGAEWPDAGNRWPHTWDEFIKLGTDLQKSGKIKYAFVGGMKYPHSWFSFFWSIWGNGGDLFLPVHERDNAVLAKNGWKCGLDQPEAIQAVEFWWDVIHKYKLVPPGEPTYTRTDANAIFQGGDAAITMADTTFYGEFNNPAKSKVAGKISVAPFIMGPSAKFKSIAWRDPWAWAIPKSVSAEKIKLIKEMLSWITLDKNSQVDLWKQTGGIPPNLDVQAELKQTDPLFRKMEAATSESQVLIHGAFYFARWPEAYATMADYLVRAVTGPRDSISDSLKQASLKVHDIAAHSAL